MVGMEAPANHPIHSFHAALRNLQKLVQDDFREIIKSQLRPTLRERYLTINYHRAMFNVEMMAAVKDTRQFQTLSLLARTIFELALEMKCIIRDPDAERKVELFSKMEVLRSARAISAFMNGRPEAHYYQQHIDFVNKQGAQIDTEHAAMWPPVPGKKQVIKHWTLKTIRQRARDCGDPFDRIYEVNYSQPSWMTHSGVVTPLNMTSDWVTSFVSTVYAIAIDSYVAILEMLVVQFKLSLTNEHVMRKIVCNRDLGFTSTPQEGAAVMRKHGLWGFSSRRNSGPISHLGRRGHRETCPACCEGIRHKTEVAGL